MSRALRLWPLLTGTHRYEKIVSTRNRGHGEYLDAPILAYLIESPNGRILYVSRLGLCRWGSDGTHLSGQSTQCFEILLQA
jgi:hypothetical protein